MIENFSCLMEEALIFWLLAHTLGKRSNSETRKILRVVLQIGIMAGIVAEVNSFVTDSTIRVVLYLFLHMAYAWIFFSGSQMEKTVWGGSIMVIILVSERIVFRGLDLFYNMAPQRLMKPGNERYLAVLCYLIVFAAIVAGLIRLRPASLVLPKSYQILFLLFAGGIAVLLDLMSDIITAVGQTQLRRQLSILTDLSCFLMIVAMLAVIFLLEKAAKLYREQNEKLDFQRREEYYHKQVETMRASDETLRQWKHDYQKHLRVLRSFLDEEDYDSAKSFLSDLDFTYQKALIPINSGNRIADTVLAFAKWQAEQKHTRFCYEIYMGGAWKRVSLQEVELSALLGNLLDNAQEAVCHIPEEQREICVSIKEIRDQIMIKVENSCDGIYQYMGNEIKSRKTESGHGLGLRRVRKIAEGAGGCLVISIGDCRFQASVMIPAEGEAEHV